VAKIFTASEVLVDDALVPRGLQKRLAELTALPIWAYGWKSNPRKDRYSYWHAHFAGGGARNRRNCEAELASVPELAPVLDLWRRLNSGPLAGHEPLRVYANSHTFGVEGYVHADSRDTQNYFSTIYFAHPVWHHNWSGETVFYSRDRRDILTSVYPKPGRVVTFPGAMPHCARAPSRDCPELRITVVIKTQRARR
jgi:SM-20-related protein